MQRRTVLAGFGGLSSGIALSGCLSDDGVFSSSDDEIDEFERGDIEIVVDGESVESMDRLQAENADNDSIDFHLHEFDDYWYMEGEERVTVAEGIDLLPQFEYEQVEDDHVVTFDGTVYDGSDPETEISFAVDDEEVDPTAYELADRDALRLEIVTAASSDDSSDDEPESSDDDADGDVDDTDDAEAADDSESNGNADPEPSDDDSDSNE